jgi:hypothetical protein
MWSVQRPLWLVAIVVATSLVGSVPDAFAVSPALVAVGQTGSRTTASWSLPAGEQSELVEVASSAATGPDGYFSDANVVDFTLLGAADTSWASTLALTPGTYYVHVKGWDADQDPFSTDWSGVLALVIPAPDTGSAAPIPATPDPVVTTPSPTTITPPPVVPAKTAGRVTRLWVSVQARGAARTAFAATRTRIYVNLGWRILPVPNAGFRLVFERPGSRVDRTFTVRLARRGSTESASIPNLDFRRRAGRWNVKVLVGKTVVATRSFLVQAAAKP